MGDSNLTIDEDVGVNGCFSVCCDSLVTSYTPLRPMSVHESCGDGQQRDTVDIELDMSNIDFDPDF